MLVWLGQAYGHWGSGTFGSEILGPLQFIHRFQGLGFFVRKGLFVIKFARPAYPIQQNPTSTRVLEEKEDGKHENSNACGPKSR